MMSRAGFLVLVAMVLGVAGALVPRALAQDQNAWIDAARTKPQTAVRAPAVPVPDRKPARPPLEAAGSGQEAVKETPRTASAAPPPTGSGTPPPNEVKSADPGPKVPELDIAEEEDSDLLPQSAKAAPSELETEKSETDKVVSAPASDDKAPPPDRERSAANAPPTVPKPEPAAVARKQEPGGSWLHERDIAAPAEAAPRAGLPVSDGAPSGSVRPSGAGNAAIPLPERKPAKPVRRAAREESSPKAKKKRPQGGDQTAKCVALGQCRDAFARCKKAYVEKTGEWDLEKEPCGAKYQACIKKHFAPGEMFFTRWFWPYDACP